MLSARSPGVRKALGAWSARVDADNACLGTGWALAIPNSRYWEGRGWVVPLPGTHPACTNPGYTPPPPSDVSIPVHPVTTRTRVLGSAKEILGVDNALWVSLGPARLT